MRISDWSSDVCSSDLLGDDRRTREEWEAAMLMARRAHPGEILVDQGEADAFIERQLHPQTLEAAAKSSGQNLWLRLHAGYEHSYWFIQRFVSDHLAHHAMTLLDGNTRALTKTGTL